MSDALFTTTVADSVVPTMWDQYGQMETEVKSALVTSGLIQRDPAMDSHLSMDGGKTFEAPSWDDLDDDAANIATDAPADMFAHTLNTTSVDMAAAVLSAYPGGLNDGRPKALDSLDEIAVRLCRAQSWAGARLTAMLAGSDPIESAMARNSAYWMRELEGTVIALVQGVSKDNATNDSGDYANDVAGAAFVDGQTNFTLANFIDTTLTMGDSTDNLGTCFMHSTVYGTALKNNAIEFRPDSENPAAAAIPFYNGRRVFKTDRLPSGTDVVRADASAGVAGMFETWIFGPGALRLGFGSHPEAAVLERKQEAGGGWGQSVLWTRRMYSVHPTGHAFVASTIANGGPSNAATTNNLNHAGSWNRVFSERKQIPFARLITREF